MMPQMPSMPNLPKQEIPSSGESQGPQAPFTEGSGEQSSGPDVGLNVPSHDPVPAPPKSDVSLPPPSNQVPVVPGRQGGIKVEATRKGFYNQMRYKEGDQFVIRSEEEFGEWMKCLDPSMEKKRAEFFKQKKARK